MATIGDVATAVSLIGKVIKAATDAQMMKKEFKELADYLELVGRQLEMLDDRELGDASMQTFQKMEEVLLQCHDLAYSCQQRSSIYLMVKGKRIQNELRGAQEKITKYLTLIPLIHFTQVFRRSKEEDTKINENRHEHAGDESDSPGLVEEIIAEFTDSTFKSNAQLFTYEQIVKITFNFKTFIGQGSFGIVYYGLLEDGTDVAIKLRSQSSSQDYMEFFFAELRSLTRVRHTHIISLIGYCKDGSNLAIVYEYMPRGSLFDHLRGKADFPVLTWAQRLQIAYQVALGLDYLHTGCNPPIIHRDVKSSNILLGADLEVKITDFGLSMDRNENDTDTTTEVVGTFGYLDPEYFRTGHVSNASDVYSFGIILLEMITGRPPVIRGEVQPHIVEWISQTLEVDSEVDIVDRRLCQCYDPSSMRKALQLALSCTDSSASMRPRMAEVAIHLKEIVEMKPFKQTTKVMDDEDMENEEVEEDMENDRHHNTLSGRFGRCKNRKENIAIEQIDEEIKMVDEERATLLSRVKVLEEKLLNLTGTKQALGMKLESMNSMDESTLSFQ